MMKKSWLLLIILLGLVSAVPASAAPHSLNISWVSNNVGATPDGVSSVVLGDLDLDEDLDIVSGIWSYDLDVIAWENDGSPFTGLWTPNGVGAGAGLVSSVALGDLDDDGDLDVVCGSAFYQEYGIIAWENDGSPFTGLWTPNGVVAGVGHVFLVALGDLDDDGDLDIVSGADEQVIAWENDGSPFSGFWTQNYVGSAIDAAFSVALGDLDDDGDLDIVSGGWSAGEGYEVIVWENDGSPFTGLWTQNGVGASADFVQSVALGDLDDDGDLDIVSGSWAGEDYEVIVWENDGSPFTGLWTQNDVGVSTDNLEAVALGDLDDDGDLDIVSGAGKQVKTWENDGSPFTGLWGQSDVGATTGHISSMALGDLDNDEDLDVVSASGSGEFGAEVIAWQNLVPAASLTVSIDIKPGSDPNSINCNNIEGVITVAILTTEEFDATTVDHTSVTFEGAGETHVAKKSGEPRRHEEDVDYDGDTDLLFHFRLGDTDLTCDSTEGMLTGETFYGLPIEGIDTVRMIDRGGKR
jgi:hypothetical protein